MNPLKSKIKELKEQISQEKDKERRIEGRKFMLFFEEVKRDQDERLREYARKKRDR